MPYSKKKWNIEDYSDEKINLILKYLYYNKHLGFISLISVDTNWIYFKCYTKEFGVYIGETEYYVKDFPEGHYLSISESQIEIAKYINSMILQSVDEMIQKLSEKFISKISLNLQKIWYEFLTSLNDVFIQEIWNNDWYLNYDEEDGCIKLTLFNENVCIYIYENESVFIETSDIIDTWESGKVGEFVFTNKLNTILTNFSNK